MSASGSSRLSYIAIAVAVSSAVLGAATLAMRFRGWALDWPWSWLVRIGSIGPCVLALALLGVAGWQLGRGRARSAGARVRSALPWLVAMTGLGVASYGMSGAAVSSNPFDSTLPTADLPPRDHGAVLVFRAGEPVDVVDLRTRGVYRYAPTLGLAERVPQVLAGYWSPDSHEIVLRGSRYTTTSEVVTYSLGLDGALRELSALPGESPCGSSCALVSGSRLGCVQRAPLPAAIPQRYRMDVCMYALGAGTSQILSWPPMLENGVATVMPDGATVLFTDRCDGEAYGDHCLYHAALDGSARSFIGRLGGNGCAIVFSPDATHAAIAARGDSYPNACSRLFVVDLAAHGRPRHIADFEPHPAQYYAGIMGMAFSPDGTQLAVLSDEDMGCSGSEGISTCIPKLSTLRIDGRERRRVNNEFYDDSNTLVWVQ